MTTIKTFFEKNNLNRGYGKNTQDEKIIGDDTGNKTSLKQMYTGVLPISMVERYEELSPGSLSKIVEMSAVEQKHRHALEERHQHSLEREAKFGRYFSILVICIISSTTLALSLYGNQFVAGVFSVLAFSAVYLMSRLVHIKHLRSDQTMSSKRYNDKYNNRRRGNNLNSETRNTKD